MFNLTVTAPISLFVSLAALTGVTFHDTKADKLATQLIGVPSIMSSTDGQSKTANLETNAHTHVERVSLNNLNSQARIAPRIEHKKHMIQKNAPKGTHAFDGYALPLD